LDDALPAGAGARLGEIWECHWPADHKWGLVSLATYPIRAQSAIACGWLLAEEFLGKIRGAKTVTIIAHSLGCRVGLDAVKWIRDHKADYTGAKVRALFLLAAAVPVEMCLPNGQAPFSEAEEGSSEYVFYSHRDLALYGFRPAQFPIGAPAERGPAVGHDGRPAFRWTNEESTGLRHKQYWRSSLIAERILELLGIRQVRRLSTRGLFAQPSADRERELVEWLMAERMLPMRTMR
jgi:pimeloyl-ACP methyl ester carboxylesterase